jgi:hypothetical protein
MKYLHRINIVLFILNGLLFLTIIYGFMFLMVTGLFQIIINIHLYSNYKKRSIEIKKKLNYHSALSGILLTIMLLSFKLPHNLYHISGTLIILSISLSIPLGVYHYHITSTIEKDELQHSSI